MLWLYRLMFLPALLGLLPYFLWRTRGRGGGWRNLRERFGRFTGVPPRTAGVPRIWLQAVSVGELLAVVPLLETLRRATGAEIFLTTTTTTGFALAEERLAGSVIGPAFFPIDFWPWMARAWRAVSPDLVILVEGERWPEHIHQAHRRGVPVVCVNARLSERGFRRARRLRWLAMPAWRGITHLLAGTPSDAERFRQVGFAADRVRLTGSIKFDVELPRLSIVQREDLRRELGLGDGLIIVGASTWAGEEMALAQVLRDVRASGCNARLLLVPRHVERRNEIAGLLRGTEFSHHLRSTGVYRGEAGANVDIAVGDTTGELRQFLQLAAIVFVGRSLPPHAEGQTPIEAVLHGLPVVFGPGMSNFRDVADGLVSAGAAVRVRDAAELARECTALLRDERRRQSLAAAARQWAESNRGAVLRSVEIIKQALSAARRVEE